MIQKRYQYWGSVNGVPQIMRTPWFKYEGPREPIQLKAKHSLKNEYREIE